MSFPAIQSLANLYPKRWDRWYIRAKFRSDPLYAAVFAELHDTSFPLLDIGCGLGLLAFCLRRRGCAFPVLGLDYDIRKIHTAQEVARVGQVQSVTFQEGDVRFAIPPHHGSITILDMLQFFDRGQQASILQQAAERLAPGAKLVIRSGLHDRSLRFHLTVAGDILAKATCWMKAGPASYPCAQEIRTVLSPYGLVRMTPLWGNTPFNNHLIVLTRE